MNPIENDVIKKAIKWRKQVKKKSYVMTIMEWELYQAIIALEALEAYKDKDLIKNN